MKTLLVSLSLLVLTLTSCAPQIMPATSAPTSIPTMASVPTDIPMTVPAPTQVSADLTPAEQAAISSLSSTLNLPADKITVVSSDAVIWPNGCMGVQRIGVMCTMNQVPGFRIILEANGTQYEFHTNRDGSMITPGGGMQASGPAQDAVRKYLASMLGIDTNQISVVSDAEVEWPDSCLGIPQSGMLCAQIVTPGHLIVLEANNVQYEYHTNGDGSQIQAASLLLTWEQSGGIAGRCDKLTIYLAGEVHASSCGDAKDGTVHDLLTKDEQTQLAKWTAEFGQVLINLSDPKGAADAMTRTLTLSGSGSQQPSPDEQKTMDSWAQKVYEQMKLGN